MFCKVEFVARGAWNVSGVFAIVGGRYENEAFVRQFKTEREAKFYANKHDRMNERDIEDFYTARAIRRQNVRDYIARRAVRPVNDQLSFAI